MPHTSMRNTATIAVVRYSNNVCSRLFEIQAQNNTGASAPAAVNGLASLDELREPKTVRCALDCRPRYSWAVDKELTLLRIHFGFFFYN
jgi:hypothetical protein